MKRYWRAVPNASYYIWGNPRRRSRTRSKRWRSLRREAIPLANASACRRQVSGTTLWKQATRSVSQRERLMPFLLYETLRERNAPRSRSVS